MEDERNLMYYIKWKKYKKTKKFKIPYFAIKHHFFLVFVTNIEVKMKKIFLEKELMVTLKVITLVTNIKECQKIYNHV